MTASQTEQDLKISDESKLKKDESLDSASCCVSRCDDVYAMDATACIGCSSCPELE
ncbi:MAG: hypothetical protein E6713_15805 [Sporomusaceae bacterium]|nr:hypothetical protein [Sporomusaceae bacterium]